MAPKTDVIEQLRERVRELEEENARLKRTNSSYAHLTKAQESQLTNLRQRLYQLKGADSAIDSERQANCELTEQLAAAQEEWNQCSGLLDDALRSIEKLEDQLATAEQRVAEVTALNPILEILDPARRLFIIANRLELKYLPIYADQPDPTYITKWVWEVRDQFGASVCEAHEWLYQAIDNAEKAISANGASS